MKVVLVVLLLVPMAVIYGQKKARLDSLLLNERTMDRPLLTHAGQLRMSMDYAFSGLNSRFDKEGDKIKLSEQGSAGIRHNLLLGVEYGIFEFVELSALLNYESSILREQSVNILTLDPVSFQPNPPLNIQETRYNYGLKDMLIDLHVMAPFKSNRVDLVFSAGVTVPIGSAKPDQPDIYSYNLVVGNETLSREIEYYYYDRQGTGVFGISLGSQLKYRFDDLAVAASFNYQFPTAESESHYWMTSGIWTEEFEYRSVPYAFLPADRYSGWFEVEYQLYPFINLFLDYQLMGTSGGWTLQTGSRVAFRDIQLHQINPGVEILLTSKFWLRQRFAVSASGKNSFAPVSYETRLIYNLSPF